MGRPRKRQFIESTDPATTLDTDPLDLAPFPSMVDNTAPYIDPIDALFSNDNPQPENPNVLDPQLHSKHGVAYSRWQFGGTMSGPPVNYGNKNSGSDGPPINHGDNNSGSNGSSVSGDMAPQLSNGSSSDSASSPQIALVPCGCLASSMSPPLLGYSLLQTRAS